MTESRSGHCQSLLRLSPSMRNALFVSAHRRNAIDALMSQVEQQSAIKLFAVCTTTHRAA
jgi:hypothetical protein